MRYEYFRRWLQKDGNAPDEYEDAFFMPPYRSATFPKRFAVIDGATEAFESRRFALMLASQFGSLRIGQPSDELLDSLWGSACEDWRRFCDEAQRRGDEKGRPLTFLDEIGLRKGAAAAFCGLFLWRPEWNHGARWQAHAVGDCCVVHRRGERFSSFPLESPEEFTSTPDLVSSNPELNRSLADRLRTVHGEYRDGDRFYLMSDALACWFLEEAGVDREPWQKLDRIGERPSGSFTDLVTHERRAGRLKNDDVTLISLSITR